MELFHEQGFAATTVPEITARAGLTTRTFFRHFADKREVLFAFESQLPGIVAEVLRDAPSELSPLEVAGIALERVANERLGGARDYLSAQRAVIQSDDGLRERELRKHSVLTEAAKAGFLERGMTEVEATVAAHVSVAVFTISVERWLDNEGDLVDLLRETNQIFANTVRG